MVISGYLFYPALQKKSFVDIAGGKISQLITPVFFWFAIASLIFNNKITIDSVTHTIVYGLWFIWTLYVASVLIAYAYYLNKNLFIQISIAIFAALLMFSDSDNISKIKFMMPYFIFGIACHFIYPKIRNRLTVIAIACTILWVASILYWKTDYYIYTTGMDSKVGAVTEQLINNAYRYIAGFLGVISVSFVVYRYVTAAWIQKPLAVMGRYTFTIYIIQTFIFSNINGAFNLNTTTNGFVYSLILTPSISLIIIIFIILTSKLLEKNDMTRQLLLGGRQ